MACLDILLYPHPILRKKCKDVEEVNEDVTRLLDDMIETMFSARGLGLAAPQVGITSKVVVIDAGAEQGRGSEIVELINPRITFKSEEKIITDEGCLSFPNIYADVERHRMVRFEALNRKGEHFLMEAEGLFAVAIQHEMDHLNGIVFIEHISRLRQSMIKRKMRKMTKGHKLIRQVRRRA